MPSTGQSLPPNVSTLISNRFHSLVSQLSRGSTILILAHHRQQLQHQQRLHLVERVHKSALQPLGNCRSRMAEAKLVQDVVDAIRLNGFASPRQQSHCRF